VRFLVDAQLPPALARLIAERGHVAEHVTDIGPGDAPDRDLWGYALAHQAVIVTKDEDFADMVALVAWFEPLIEQVVAMVESGDRLIELR
jgi:predicted nuclease of predicted toxin-antitoxin system